MEKTITISNTIYFHSETSQPDKMDPFFRSYGLDLDLNDPADPSIRLAIGNVIEVFKHYAT